MSKLTPSALRGLSVAAGTVGLAAVGAAAMAGQASAAIGTPDLAGNGLPVSTNAVPAVLGAVAHNNGAVAGIPLSGFPVLGQLPGMFEDASPTPDALPGLGYADLGELPLRRSRPMPGTEGLRTPYVPQHAAPSAAAAPAAPYFPPAAAPMPQAPAAPAAQTGPLDNVTNALHGLPLVGGLAGNLPLAGGLGGLAGLGG
ncbi:putative Fe-S oxidoreductase [Catenulispora acidiphila DSM 44928]|uniref:Putative Fe-S oxidoreductase n=1 Tax=Catenulispora acidiphila (strain DSM 44928 / JCM 14897 / NBRC 102108 / NRRL B-24433 / ID139908) TaxID=479433 RepID=C7Q0U7_CATAD|nr:hypothetical protein [Catenulispora acidiphila]ACU69725.1 putative Fe-S oxidoreductase [Catenulispora acidiphila DSM 44928]